MSLMRITAVRKARADLSGTDCAAAEYGITREEIQRIAADLHANAKRAVKSGEVRSFNGDIEKALAGRRPGRTKHRASALCPSASKGAA